MEDDERTRDLAMLAVPLAGAVEVTGDSWLPFRVTDPCGAVVESVSAYFRDLQAAGRSDATLRSYGMDLLRWFRFLWAVEVAWNRATRIEARDFCRWMLVSGKPSRPHWRRPHEVPDRSSTAVAYSASVRAHAETVLRGFYEFHLAAGSGPIVNPFPLHRSRRGGRAYAHHSPMESHRKERTGLYRPRVPSRIPRSIPDEEFNEIFARLPSNRDRALVAFYVSTGARASELLSATRGDVDPGRQVIALVRKGSRAVQELPASTDAFVWLRLYQVETEGLVPKGKRQPLWWTSRTPMRPLTYHAAHRMFERAAQRAGSAATLHALRHTAAYRMAEDPALPLTDVQCVLGHALLTTTQIYLTPRKEEVIRRVLAHHAEQTRQAAERARPAPAPGYRPETLKVLFGSPSLSCLVAGAAGKGSLTRNLARTRDPHGFARLRALCAADPHVSGFAAALTLRRSAEILAAKGGTLADVTVGDALELMDREAESFTCATRDHKVFYRMLRELGVFSDDAPQRLRAFRTAGQLTPEELVDRYRLHCRPVRNLLVDYLRERQPALDYTSLKGLAYYLAQRFWADLEQHHPGIDSLHLSGDVADAWKQRQRTKPRVITSAHGEKSVVMVERIGGGRVVDRDPPHS